MNRYTFLLLLFLPAACNGPELMRVPEIMEMPTAPADVRVAYGPADTVQFGDLRLPGGDGPHPVVLIIHGGCWLSAYGLDLMDAMATEFREQGYATWNIEYRRVGEPGGGWPHTFLDVAAATDHLRTLAEDYPLDLERVVAVGHSAGGHLALWLGMRDQLPDNSDLYPSDPLPLKGIVSLAGITDPESYLVRQPGSCGSSVDDLLGGLPEEQPLRYAEASPLQNVPLGTPQILISGAEDPIVPLTHVERYYKAARRAGDEVELVTVKKAGHFEVIAPGSIAWESVEEAVERLLNR
jgi:acetyl esterase/lipase